MEQSKQLEAETSQTSLKALFSTILLLSVLCLATSIIAQNWAGIRPCRLCLVQIWIYLGLAISSSLWVIRRLFWINALVLLLLSCGIFVASYQSLSFIGLIEEKCHVSISEIYAPESSQEKTIHAIGCSNQALKFWGIPAFLINLCVYLFFWIWLLKETFVRKGKQP